MDDNHTYENSAPMENRSSYRSTVLRGSSVPDENTRQVENTKQLEKISTKTNIKPLQITVAFLSVFQLVFISVIGHLLVQLQEIEPLKAANDDINATVHVQQLTIKTFKESVETLNKENNLLKDKERKLNATTKFQAQQIKNMSELLTLLSTKNENLKQIVTNLNTTTEIQTQKIKNTSEALSKVVTSAKFLSCKESSVKGNDVAYILRNGNTYNVYCDRTTDGGGWTVFQRRLDGSVDFYRTWDEYAQGFGSLTGEFWLGLENVYQLTQDGDYELRVDITDWEGNSAFAKYKTFSVTGRSDNYRLTVGQYSGDSNAGDSLQYHNKQQFSAKDKSFNSSCATNLKGAWWYNACAESSLNGVYNDTSSGHGVFWHHWKKTFHYSLKTSEIKFRKK